MIDAEIKGKLPEVQHFEDVLTSCYFGLIKYCSTSVLKDFFLDSVKCSNGHHIDFKSISTDLIFKFFFWPRFEDRSEPDLLIAIFDSLFEVKYLFLIEVKYFSQQNIYETSDEFESHNYENQLSREYHNLISLNKFDDLILNEDTKRFLIYLTADNSLPKDDFERVFDELKNHPIPKDASETLLWVSWYDLFDKLDVDTFNLSLQKFEKDILNDLKNYLFKKKFWSFRGFGPFKPGISHINFMYSQSKAEMELNWHFQEPLHLNFMYHQSKVKMALNWHFQELLHLNQLYGED